MLVIRLFRVGKKNQPSYKIVVIDKTKAPARGRFVEEVGFYNPLTKERILKGERIKYWMSQGVKPSDTVYNMLISSKVIEGKKVNVYKKSKKEAEAAPAAPPAPAPEKPAEAAAAPEPEKPAEAPAAPEPEKKAEEAAVEEKKEEKQAS